MTAIEPPNRGIFVIAKGVSSRFGPPTLISSRPFWLLKDDTRQSKVMKRFFAPIVRIPGSLFPLLRQFKTEKNSTNIELPYEVHQTELGVRAAHLIQLQLLYGGKS